MMLEVKDLSVYYGMIKALDHVSINVKEGEIVTIVGANGAGKSTLMNTIAGLVKPSSGSILFNGEKVPTNSYDVVKKGISLVPEGRRIFAPLTVRENLRMGAYLLKNQAEYERREEEVFALFPRLKERINQVASTLSGGEQQMLAMGRSLVANPKMILLDEPSMGLAPILVSEIFKTIKRLNDNGSTILLVEQNARAALMCAQRAYVFQTGKVIIEGNAHDLLNNPEVEAAYLGKQKE